MTWRAALIGCGRIGSEFAAEPGSDAWGICTHAGAYAACRDTEMVAVCDSDASRAERCARHWNVPAFYTDAARMLADRRPELVSICTPDATHYEMVRAALLADGVKAVLAEKPLATGLRHGEELAQLAKRRGIVLAVNYSRRYAESHVRMREQVREGSLGKIRLIRGLYTKGTAHNGTHWFDLARFFVSEPTAVRALNRLGEHGEDPTLDVQLTFRSGAVAELHACPAEEFTVFEMELFGSHGRVRLIESGSGLERYEVVEGKPFAGYRSLVLRERSEGGMRDVLLHAVQDMVKCLETGASPRCSGADGLAALRVALAARQSAATGVSVSLEDR